MARILRIVVIVGVALGFGGGLAGCGPGKSGGPTDPEQEKRFIEKWQRMKPGGAPKETNGKAKAEEEKKEKAKVPEESKEKAKAAEAKKGE